MIHGTAEVHETAVLGEGTVVWGGACVMAGVTTGVHCSIGRCSELSRAVRLGDHVRIGYGVFIPTRTRIGHRVFIGPGVVMCDDKRPRVNPPMGYTPNPPTIEDDVSIGAGVVIGPGVHISSGAFVGAGAVLIENLPAHLTVVGNPARPLRKCTVCGQRKRMPAWRQYRCPSCEHDARRATYAQNRLRALEHYSGGQPHCICCGETTLHFLALDHIAGGGNAHRGSLGGNAGHFARWLRAQGYPDGYRVLCHNCNGARGYYGRCPHEAADDTPAGAVVTRDVEPYQTVVGNPARPLRVAAVLEAR